MKGYLGETVIEDLKHGKFEHFTKSDWAEMWIEQYSQIDGEHHKEWVFDQVMRMLKGTRVIVSIAEWDNGFSEHRFNLAEPSKEYLAFVERSNYMGYSWSKGIAP